MVGICLKSSVVYHATVTTVDNMPARIYVGLTETPFKTRFVNRKSSFNNPNKKLSAELSKHVRCLKEARLKFKIIWKCLKKKTLFTTCSQADVICAFGRNILSFEDLN